MGQIIIKIHLFILVIQTKHFFLRCYRKKKYSFAEEKTLILLYTYKKIIVFIYNCANFVRKKNMIFISTMLLQH